MTSIPPSAEQVLRLLLEGLAGRLNWTCHVFDAPGHGGTTVLRSEFTTYTELEGQLLRLRSQCDREPVPEDAVGGIDFRLRVEPITTASLAPSVAEDSDAIRLFGLLRRQLSWVLEMEARLPLSQEPAPFHGTFDEFVDRVNRQSPALWNWRLLTHEGSVRALEHRYETCIEDLRLTLHEFVEAATGVVQCFATAEWAAPSERLLPVFDGLEASVLVALVKRHALAARKAQG